jgi:hypothetical protein
MPSPDTLMRLTPAVLLLLFAVAARAEDKQTFDTLPEPPPPVKNYKSPPRPAEKQAEPALPEPEVTITTHGEERHEEYRIAGRLYMVKVTPKHGRPYYLVDKTGKGEFTRSDFQPSISPPMWVIKRF